MAVSDLNRPSHRLAGGHGEAPYEWPDLAAQVDATHARVLRRLLESDADPRDTQYRMLDEAQRAAIESAIRRMER